MRLIKAQTPLKPSHVLIDNWYSPSEEKRIWKELDFYSEKDKFERAEWQEIATDEKGKHLGEHFRIHLDKFYTNEARDLKISDILNFVSKAQTDDFRNAIKKCAPAYSRTFTETNISYTLVSYYDNADYYKPHHDSFFWTILIWFYREPQAFTGGDLIFPEFHNYRVECKHNRLIAFPCFYLHGSETVNLPEEKRDKSLGKYTITHFFHFDTSRRTNNIINEPKK